MVPTKKNPLSPAPLWCPCWQWSHLSPSDTLGRGPDLCSLFLCPMVLEFALPLLKAWVFCFQNNLRVLLRMLLLRFISCFVLCVCECVSPGEGVRSPGAGVAGDGSHWARLMGNKLRSSVRQHIFLTSKSLLHPQKIFY